MYNQVEVAELLISKGADVNEVCKRIRGRGEGERGRRMLEEAPF